MHRINNFSVILIFLLISVSCQKEVQITSWLDSVHEEGRGIFYQTIKEEINIHPKKSELTETEITKIMEAEAGHNRLYELLLNIFYQKDEPIFKELIEIDDKISRSHFHEMYLDLVRFSAHMFVESFFATNRSTQIIREMIPAYKDLDAVDLVIRSIGYHAKLDTSKIGLGVATFVLVTLIGHNRENIEHFIDEINKPETEDKVYLKYKKEF